MVRFSLRCRLRTTTIQGPLGLKPLLLCIERSQLGQFKHLIRMTSGCLPQEVFQAQPTRRRPQGRPRILCGLEIPWDAPEGAGEVLLGGKMPEVPSWTCCLSNSTTYKLKRMNEWMAIWKPKNTHHADETFVSVSSKYLLLQLPDSGFQSLHSGCC